MRMPPGWDGLDPIEHLWRADPGQLEHPPNHFSTVPAKARAEKKGCELTSGLFIYCGGTVEWIPSEERPQMGFLVNQSMGELPWIGVFTWREQGYIPEMGNMHSNLSPATVLFPGDQPR